MPAAWIPEDGLDSFPELAAALDAFEAGRARLDDLRAAEHEARQRVTQQGAQLDAALSNLDRATAAKIVEDTRDAEAALDAATEAVLLHGVELARLDGEVVRQRLVASEKRLGQINHQFQALTALHQGATLTRQRWDYVVNISAKPDEMLRSANQQLADHRAASAERKAKRMEELRASL
jgi:hypothetical protein